MSTETTGLDPKTNSIIEIGLRLIEINRETGELLSVGESYNGLPDPGHPIDPATTAVHHLSDAEADLRRADGADRGHRFPLLAKRGIQMARRQYLRRNLQRTGNARKTR